ncbi:hypothetical protein M406DRAFT_332778 [Cryphonectria parasitica EP155]|uniref:Uncharacterized protein n=1 Tax=Cryphonectria parasitica (strain ATCC 38755 / EP155) TaxID=660469 RepID=A0A9P5CLU5_CRYP1|nr:uncharacterized protein M406DRAFT_332778 [Cryphonectria parasitica EP155]KAF3762396.1 hypothetical protein M406DRAFT_332778 [Cryphonectria parasitica EP155]
MANEITKAIQTSLEQYVRPREEAEHIRRVLALNLQSCHENGPMNGPLALAEPDCVIKTTDARGLQRDYLKALHANIKAQRAYDEAVNQSRVAKEVKSGNERSLNNASRLEEHVAGIELRRKQERLQTVEKYIDLLSQKPAADPKFLQSEEVFKDTRRLPEVPKAVISGFTVDKGATKTDLKTLVDRLEKAVLRSKLLLKKEEQLLEEVKSRFTATPGKISLGDKSAALSATRNELITWMETELGKTSGADDGQEDGPDGHGRSPTKMDKAHMDAQLALIKDKYATYVAERKALIQLAAQSPRLTIKPPEETKQTAQLGEGPHPPSDYLITPYIRSLLSVAHEQKASIAQKAHLNDVLAKQTEVTGRALSRLAEESQLLPEHPTRRHQGRSGGSLPEKCGDKISVYVQPWVVAADSAKLSTLEAVAEKIEKGQVALEGSTKHLFEIDQLLGRGATHRDEAVDEDSTMDDIWLAETASPKKGSKAPLSSRGGTSQERGDVWSSLNGVLGLINAGDSPRK